ncbi:LysR family transcriptional regulator [Rhizobium sp.]|jgi:DNA-binding transcriptional LysR family regulator|uniref:LysR family transcriptional regulator n=1 Tax=Rhizobium sp. TaxID=391 RepID=UPI000E90D3DD|nr:LysR family transcriptional regulator [Rhizobium sp.]
MEILDAKALRIFMAVVRYSSIRSAADHLSIAPSIVSRQVADIEKNVGLPLFNRSSRGVTLTDAGVLVLEHGKRVLEDGGLLEEQLEQLKGVQQSRVRICCGEGFLADLIEHGLQAFVDVYPSISYALHLGGTDGVMQAVIEGDADIGIAYNPVIEPKVRSLAISRQPLCAIVHPSSPFVGRETVPLVQCMSLPCALLGKGHGVTDLVGRVAANNGHAMAPLVVTTSVDALRRFVVAGLGVTYLPRFAVATELARGTVEAIELSDPLLNEACAHLMVKARRRLPNSVTRLASHLATAMSAFKSG